MTQSTATKSPDADALAARIEKTRLASRGWHIQRLAGQLDRAMNAKLAPHGLTVQTFALVMMTAENDGLSQAAISEQFSAPAYAITRSLDQLESDGFLERRPHPTSRRTNGVHATAKTLALVPALLDIIDEVNAALVADLEPQEAKSMLSLLERVLAKNEL
ncbi:MAG: MarR family transcriptional regulator [Pseudomonadota bacterium]